MHHPSITAASRLRHALVGTVALAGLLAAGTAAAQTTTADPMRDPRYMSGHREATPPEIPEEFRDADALTRVKGVKRITACADPYAFPSTEITDAARGFDVDILKAIAREQGWETFFIWVNTSGRGGMNRAVRTSIKKGICDVFLGLGTGGLDPEPGQVAPEAARSGVRRRLRPRVLRPVPETEDARATRGREGAGLGDVLHRIRELPHEARHRARDLPRIAPCDPGAYAEGRCRWP